MKDWINNWLSGRQRDEIEYFHRKSEAWKASSKEDVYKIAREIKDAYDHALRLFEDEGATGFHQRWLRATGNATETRTDDEGRKRTVYAAGEDRFMVAVMNCVANYELGATSGYGPWLGGPVELFRLVDGRGSHFKKRRKVSTPEVKQAAKEVVERDGWEAYPVQRRSEKGPGFPNTFLEAVAQQLKSNLELSSVSPSTARRHLEKTDFTMPSQLQLKRRSR